MLTKPVIDIDPDLLRRSAEAQVHAAEEGWNHVRLESTGHVPTILGTLVPGGPWAWAIMMIPQPDGSIVLPVHTSYEGIEEMYTMIRGHSDVLGAEPVLEVRGEWYSMHEDVATSQEKATGDVGEREMVLVLPVTNGPGITGELAWVRMDRTLLGKDLPVAEPKSPREIRRHLLALHNQLMEALRANDADALVALFSPGCQSAIRDYVEDTGTITGLDDLAGLRDHLRAFFDLYEVQSVELLRARRGGVVSLRGAPGGGDGPVGRRGRQPVGLPHRNTPGPRQGGQVHRSDRARHRPGPRVVGIAHAAARAVMPACSSVRRTVVLHRPRVDRRRDGIGRP